MHPPLRFAFEVPSGYKLVNLPDVVAIKGPQGTLGNLTLANPQPSGSLTAALQNYDPKGAIVFNNIETLTINGMEAATAVTRVNTRSGAANYRAVLIRHPSGKVYEFVFLSLADAGARYDADFQKTATSFRQIDANEAAAIQQGAAHPRRDGEAGRHDPVDGRQMVVNDGKEQWFRVLNGLENAKPAAGRAEGQDRHLLGIRSRGHAILGEKAPRRRWRLPIWLVLALAFGSLTTATATVIGVLFYVTAFGDALELALDLGDAELSRINSTVNAQLQPAADQARFLADYISRGRVSPSDDQRLQDLLLGSIGAVRQLSGVGFVRPNLRIVGATAIAQGRSYVVEAMDLSGNAAVAAMMQQAQSVRVPFWAGPLRFAEGKGELLLVAVAPVSGDNGRFVGIIAAAVSLRAASTRLATLAGDDGVPFVVTDSGRIIMHSSSEIGEILERSEGGAAADFRRFRSGAGCDALAARAMRSMPTSRTAPQMSASPRLLWATPTIWSSSAASTALARRPGIIGYHVPQSWADDVLQTINSAIPFAAIMVGMAILVAFFLGRAIGNPIQAFASNARRIAQMELDAEPNQRQPPDRARHRGRGTGRDAQWSAMAQQLHPAHIGAGAAEKRRSDHLARARHCRHVHRHRRLLRHRRRP